jgi:hypothetical protein
MPGFLKKTALSVKVAQAINVSIQYISGFTHYFK